MGVVGPCWCPGFCDIQDAPDDEKVKAQPVSGLEDQRAPRPVEPEVLAYDGDHPLCATRQPQKRQPLTALAATTLGANDWGPRPCAGGCGRPMAPADTLCANLVTSGRSALAGG